jgi:hypothetical protein
MIADELGLGRHKVRYNCDPEYRAKHLERAKKYSSPSRTHDNKALGLSASKVIPQERVAPVVPRDVLFERDRAMAAPARSFGDPPFERSALGKRIAAQLQQSGGE